MHGQNFICSKTHLDVTMHKPTTICRQLFRGGGGVVGSRSRKRKKKMYRMIMIILSNRNNNISKMCKYLPILVIVCWDSGKLTFHISLTWKTLFSTSDKSLYPFKSAFSLSAMKKKMDEATLDTISMDSEVRGKTWTFIEESRRRRSLVCLASEEKLRNENS